MESHNCKPSVSEARRVHQIFPSRLEPAGDRCALALTSLASDISVFQPELLRFLGPLPRPHIIHDTGRC